MDLVENSINHLLNNIQTVNYIFKTNKILKFYDIENLRIISNRLMTKFEYKSDNQLLTSPYNNDKN